MEYIFDQCIHGYSDRKGHHKIASSCSLSYQSEQTMLRMSDRSGSICNGFEEYITLYELASDHYYALSKTWEATEISRPGCVWTHTILFKKDWKNDILDLYTLVKYFKHPLKPKQIKVSSYEKSLSIPVQDVTKNNYLSSTDISKKKSILVCLNDKNPQKTILVMAKNANIYEKLIFEIWNSLKDFTFCTGSLAIREIDKTPLKVQVVPSKLFYRSDVYFIDENNQIETDNRDTIDLCLFLEKMKAGDPILDHLIYLVKVRYPNDFTKLINDAIDRLKHEKGILFNEIDFFKVYLKHQQYFDPNRHGLSKETEISKQTSHIIKELKLFLSKHYSNKTDIESDIRIFFEWKNSKESLSSIIEILQKYYPDQNQKKELKNAFLGKMRRYLKNCPEFSFFVELSKYSNKAFKSQISKKAFDIKDLSLQERVTDFWRISSQVERYELIHTFLKNRIQEDQNDFSKSMLYKVIEIIDLETFIQLICNSKYDFNTNQRKYLCYIILNFNITFYKPLWKKLQHNDTELKQYIVESFGQPPDMQKIDYAEQPVQNFDVTENTNSKIENIQVNDRQFFGSNAMLIHLSQLTNSK